MGEKIPERLVCPHCGGTEVAVQATAWWDYEKQDWEFAVDDGGDDYCSGCGSYTVGKFVPITDLKSAALTAIKQDEPV